MTVNIIPMPANPFVLPYSTITEILNIVSEQTGITKEQILSKSHKRDRSTARAVAMYLAYKSGSYTLKEVGSYFDRHYTTVIYANHSVSGLIQFDKQVREQVQEIEKLLAA